MNDIGSQIRALREKRGMSQLELALDIGTGSSAISRLENNKNTPSLSFLNRVAEALDAEIFVEVLDLIEDYDE